MKQKYTKQKKNVGRSIEETIVRRQFDSQNPITWPDALKGSVNTKSLPNLLHTNSSENFQQQVTQPVVQRNYLNQYEDEDKQKMMETLMSYCRALQTRVEDLESELTVHKNHQANQQLLSRSLDLNSRSGLGTADFYNQNRVYTGMSMPAEDLNGTGGGNRRIRILTPPDNNTRSRSSAASRETQYQVGQIITDIDHKVLNLKELFRKGDPLDERRKAATKISALIRGYLARQRYSHYKHSLREYKWSRCRIVVYLLDILLANQSKLDAGFHLLKMNRNMKTLHSFYDKWAIICKQNAPMRRAVKLAALEKIENKRIQLMRTVFDGLRSVSVGTHSTKHANAVRRKLIEGIRSEISLKLRKEGLPGIVPDDEITKVLHRRVVLNFWERKNKILTRAVYNAFVTVYRKGQKDYKKAVFHKFKVLAGKCFYAWSNFVFLVSMGLDRKRWPGPRKYEVRYNQKRVDTFSRMRCTRMVYNAWKAYFMIQYKVKQKFRGKIAQLMKTVFVGWRTETIHQHRLRVTVHDNWKGYARLMVYNPFHAWANHVRAVKNHHNEQIRICNSYVRWKMRQKMLLIVKVWRHQALYGRIDGLYSRQMLLKTLGEQKILVNGVEKLMASQTIELEECKTIVSTEITKRKQLEISLSQSTVENTKLKMTNHHFEQELKRLQSVVESMVTINPKQITHLKTMQPKFKFKERKIAISNRAAGDVEGGENMDVGDGDDPQNIENLDTLNNTTMVDINNTYNNNNSKPSQISIDNEIENNHNNTTSDTAENEENSVQSVNKLTTAKSDMSVIVEQPDEESVRSQTSPDHHISNNSDHGNSLTRENTLHSTAINTINSTNNNSNSSGINNDSTAHNSTIATTANNTVGNTANNANTTNNSTSDNNNNNTNSTNNNTNIEIEDDLNSVVSALSANSAPPQPPANNSNSNKNNNGNSNSNGNSNAISSTIQQQAANAGSTAVTTSDNNSNNNNTATTTNAPAALTHSNTAVTTAGLVSTAGATTATTAGPVVDSTGTRILDEDMLLLTRVKWLLSRYNDELKHNEIEAHMQHSLNLLVDPDGNGENRGVDKTFSMGEDGENGENSDGTPVNVPVVYEINSRPPILPVGNHVQFSNNNSYNNTNNNSNNNSNNHSNNVSYKRNITNINTNLNANTNTNINTDTNTADAIANAVANFTSPGPPISGSPYSPYKSAIRNSTGSFTPQRQHSFFNTMQKSNVHSPTRDNRDMTQSSFMSTFTRGNSTIGGMSAYDESNYGGNESTGGNSKDGPNSDPISTRILLSFIDFLDFGDVTPFTLNDRRDWIRTLLEKSYQHESLQNAFSNLTGDFPTEVEAVKNNTEVDDDDVTAHFATLDNNLNGAKSWRDALMQFRCYTTPTTHHITSGHTGSVVGSGVGGGGVGGHDHAAGGGEHIPINLVDENCSTADIAMFSRILAMRDNSETIIKRNTAKFRSKLHEKLTYQYGPNASNGMMSVKDTSEVIGEVSERDPPRGNEDLGSNIYASNLKQMRKDGTAPVGVVESSNVNNDEESVTSKGERKKSRINVADLSDDL